MFGIGGQTGWTKLIVPLHSSPHPRTINDIEWFHLFTVSVFRVACVWAVSITQMHDIECVYTYIRYMCTHIRTYCMPIIYMHTHT